MEFEDLVSYNEALEEETAVQGAQVCGILMKTYYEKYLHKNSCMDSAQTGNKWMQEVLKGSETRFYDMFRMNRDVFLYLCSELELKFGSLGSRRTSHVEVVGMCVHMLGHNMGNRLARERFQHSGETISRYFNRTLDVLCEFSKEIIKPRDPYFTNVAPEIENDPRYMPHFKDCIGAIDGVHVQAVVAPQNHVPFIGRKGVPTQNIMAVCDFDMQFTFVCAGWEGSAHDTRIFLSVLRNDAIAFPKPPQDKYYAVDGGYPQMKGYLGPYKVGRQHFQAFRARAPNGPKEVFNKEHSSLRGVIERSFGVWKKKWSVLRDMHSYSFEKQVQIIIATMTLHNFIRRHARGDGDFLAIDEGNNDINEFEVDVEEEEYPILRGDGARQMDALRDSIAQSLMNANV